MALAEWLLVAVEEDFLEVADSDAETLELDAIEVVVLACEAAAELPEATVPVDATVEVEVAVVAVPAEGEVDVEP